MRASGGFRPEARPKLKEARAESPRQSPAGRAGQGESILNRSDGSIGATISRRASVGWLRGGIGAIAALATVTSAFFLFRPRDRPTVRDTVENAIVQAPVSNGAPSPAAPNSDLVSTISDEGPSATITGPRDIQPGPNGARRQLGRRTWPIHSGSRALYAVLKVMGSLAECLV